MKVFKAKKVIRIKIRSKVYKNKDLYIQYQINFQMH